MRLIEARTLAQKQRISFEEFYGNVPRYAILSHTWDAPQEVNFQDCNSESSKSKTGYEKIRKTCELALEDDIDYVWVDTCCIDKSSSAELTEAINSMFRWYQQASVCYVYLADKIQGSSLKDCRWFYRGWTLQELIAPKYMEFFDSSWTCIGTKDGLMDHLSSITKIDAKILSHEAPLLSACIAKRLSWAAGRKTTRVEDMTYCLLGICNINMPTLYGEGQAAFYRLQKEIIESTYDLSLLAWTPPDTIEEEFCGFLAESVNDFASCSEMYTVTNSLLDEGALRITNKGLKLTTLEHIREYSSRSCRYLLNLDCMLPGCSGDCLVIFMRKIGPHTFVRAQDLKKNAKKFAPIPFGGGLHAETSRNTITLLTSLPSTTTQSPFTQARSSNVVSSSRFTLVQLDIPPNISPDWTSMAPNKFWDEEDCVFFGSHSSFHNWSAATLDDVLFVCFWTKEGESWVFQGTVIECSAEVEDKLFKELVFFAEELHYTQKTIRRLVHKTQKKMKSSIRVMDGKQLSRFSFKAEREDDRNLCSGPRWKVVFKKELIH